MESSRASSELSRPRSFRRPLSHRNISLASNSNKSYQPTKLSEDQLAIIKALTSNNVEDVVGAKNGIRELAGEINYFPEIICVLYGIFEKIPDVDSKSTYGFSQAEVIRFEFIVRLFILALDPEYENLLQACSDALENIFKLFDLPGLIRLESYLASRPISREMQVYLLIMQCWKKPASALKKQLSDVIIDVQSFELSTPLAKACWNIAKTFCGDEHDRRTLFIAGIASEIFKNGVDQCLEGLLGKLFIRVLLVDSQMPVEYRDKLVDYIANTGTELSVYPDNCDALLWALRCDWFDYLANEDDQAGFAFMIFQFFQQDDINISAAASMLTRLWPCLGKLDGCHAEFLRHYFDLAQSLLIPAKQRSDTYLLLAVLFDQLSSHQQTNVIKKITHGISHLLETNIELACERLSLLIIIAEKADVKTLENLMPLITSLILNYEISDGEESDFMESDNESACNEADDEADTRVSVSRYSIQRPGSRISARVNVEDVEQIQLQEIKARVLFLELLRPVFSNVTSESKNTFRQYLFESLESRPAGAEKLLLIKLLGSFDDLTEEELVKIKNISHPFIGLTDMLLLKMEQAFQHPIDYAQAMQVPGVGLHANSKIPSSEGKKGFDFIKIFTGKFS